MKQEEKELLLKDLCTRLPYGVKVDYFGTVKELLGIMPSSENVMVGYDINDYEDSIIEEIKPYLRSMSSMTEEEIDELKELCTMYEPTDSPNIGFEDYGIRVLTHHLSDDSISFSINTKVIDWLLKNHFDFMGLIPKGLAIEVTKENNPYKD